MSTHETTKYAQSVVRGSLRKKVCKYEYLACLRHINDLKRQKTSDFPYVFDETRANGIFNWFKRCHHVRGPFQGKSIELLDWQMFDIGCSFGWVHMDTGARRFNVSFEERARGNVKSTEKSGECLYFMCADAIYPPGKPEKAEFESLPEIECAAVDREQAKRVWGDARAMAQASPDIARMLTIKKHSIEHKKRGGHIRALSKDTKNKDGGAPCGVIVDEYHEHPTSEIRDTLKGGFGKRSQSFMRIITTAGKDSENSPAKKERDTAIKILEGIISDETYFVMIRELDEEDDPHDESNWLKPNPILRGESVYAQNLYREIKSEHDLAFGSGDPSKIREWMTKRVNRWQADSEEKYFTAELMDKWKGLAVPRDEFRKLIAGKEVFIGADLSKSIDLTATGFVVNLPDGRVAVSAHGFIPAEGATRHEHTDRVPYRHWEKDKWCTITPGAVTDYKFVKSHMQNTLHNIGLQMREFCYDSYNAVHLSQELREEYGDTSIVEIRQGVQTLSLPTKRFREMVMQGQIVHDGNPLLTWCLSNAVEVVDSNENIKLSKKYKSDSQRIDLLAAVMNAFTRAIMFPNTENFKLEVWHF
ncbi:MAG: terminase large subunit [Defluviitaleaceae bacterium]|nr:terminase large subunit [Defluviitaleaceae bacterium]MCL2263966.1 terminase large subunit [Defluviitaleaceae bacterium]